MTATGRVTERQCERNERNANSSKVAGKNKPRQSGNPDDGEEITFQLDVSICHHSVNTETKYWL